MTTVFDRTFKYKYNIKAGTKDAVQKYCERNIGPRLYYLQHDVGGRDWRIRGYVLEVNDETLLTWLSISI